jgi:hypothetical protein
LLGKVGAGEYVGPPYHSTSPEADGDTLPAAADMDRIFLDLVKVHRLTLPDRCCPRCCPNPERCCPYVPSARR